MKLKKYEILYFAGTTLAALYHVAIYRSYFREYLTQEIITLFLFFIASLFIISLFMRKWSTEWLFIALGIIAIVFAVWMGVKDNILLLYLLAIVCAYRISPQKLMKYTSVAALGCSLLVMAGSLLGLVPNDIYVHNGRNAYCFGFFYYSTLPFALYFGTTILLFLRRRNTKEFLLFYLVINGLAYYFSTTRLTLLMTCLSAVLFLIIKLVRPKKINCRFNRVLAVLLFPSVAVIDIIISRNYNRSGRFLHLVDELLNYRFALSYRAMREYNISLFGNRLEQFNNVSDYFYVDSGYIYCLLSYGVVLFTLILFAYAIISLYAVKTNNINLFCLCCFVCVFSIVNNVFVNTVTNPLLLLVSAAVASLKKTNKISICNDGTVK